MRLRATTMADGSPVDTVDITLTVPIALFASHFAEAGDAAQLRPAIVARLELVKAVVVAIERGLSEETIRAIVDEEIKAADV